jgi:hypothetical protein
MPKDVDRFLTPVENVLFIKYVLSSKIVDIVLYEFA